VHERAKSSPGVDAIEVGENYRLYHRLENSDSSRRDGRGRSEGSKRPRKSVRETGRGRRSGNGRSRRGWSGRYEIEINFSVT